MQCPPRLARRLLALVAAAFSILLATGASARTAGKLELGDMAPPLDVHFLKGEPVDLEAGKGKHVYVVEFWATWCGPCRYSIPHLTELQKEHEDDGLVVIGISNESSAVVRPYMENMGKRMDYRVAIDKNETTNQRYFWGFNVPSNYPTAFVVDVNGRVAWIGNPLDPFIDRIVETLLEDVPEREAPDKDEPRDNPADSDE